MDIEDLTDEIIFRVYHNAAQHDHPATQERIVHAEIYSLIEDYTKQVVDYRITELEAEVKRLEER